MSFGSGFAQSTVHVSDAYGSNSSSCGASGSPCATIQYAADNIAVDGDTIKIDTGLYQLASSVSQYTPVVKIPEGISLSFVGTTGGLGTRIDGDTTRRGFLYYYAGTGCPSGDTNDGISDTVHLYFQDLIVQNCHTLETCGTTTYAYGGGMRLDCDSSSEMYVNVNHCIFRNNRAFDPSGPNLGGRSASGGAIWIYGRRNAATTGPSNHAEAHISYCDFTGNYGDQISNGGHGGAVILRDLDTASISHSSFCDNYVYSQNADNGDLQHDRNAGGAVCVYDLTSSGTSHKYHIDQCTFINNSATVPGNFNFKSEAGGVFLTRGDVLSASTNAVLHISNSNFYGNVIETGIEHIDKNSGTLDTSNIGYNAYYAQFQVGLGEDTVICMGDTLILDATITGASYLWQDGSTAATYAVFAADTYMVTVTVGSCEISDTIIVDVVANPMIDLGPDTTLCPYDSLQLHATTAGASYNWSNGSIDSVTWVAGAGAFWVEVDVSGCIGTDTILMDTVAIAQTNLGLDTLLCDANTMQLNAAQTGASYLWQDGSTSATFNISVAGTYWAQVSIGPCVVSDTILVTYGITPNVDLGPDQTICPYDTIELDATYAGATYLWNDASTLATLNVFAEDEYWVDVNNGGCIGYDTINVDTITLTPVKLGPDTLICENETMLLDVFQTGATYLWQDNSTSATFLITQAGIYSVTVSKSSCFYEDDIDATFQAYPVVDLGPDLVICPYENIDLDATNANASYIWNTGQTTAVISVSDENEYWVAVDINGCFTHDTILIDTVEIPPSYLGPNQLLCPDDEFTLDATTVGASDYLWSTGSIQPSIDGNVGGLYWVEVTVDDCAVRDTIVISYVSDPLDLIGGDQSICEDESIELSIWPLGLDNYLWSNGATNQNITVSDSGVYWASVTKLGCPFSDTINLSIRPLPVVDLGDDREICAGESVLFDVTNPNASYHWNNGHTGSTRNVKNTGLYTVTVIMDNCMDSSSVNVLVKPNPAPDLLKDQSICEGRSHTFDAFHTDFNSYLWPDSSVQSSATFDSTGDYWVLVSMDGCFGSDTVHLEVNLTPIIDLGNDTVICEGDPFLLDATTDGKVLYQWQDQSHDSVFNVVRPGEYRVRLIRGACAFRDTIYVQVKAYPKLNIGNDTTICEGDSLVIDLEDPTTLYTWNGGERKTKETFYDSSYIQIVGRNYCGEIRDSITLSFRNCECYMYAPNAFTPNHDGKNETFIPKFDCDVYEYSLRIYDRWGIIIFESKDKTTGWSGTKNGVLLPIDVYYYELNYKVQLRENGSRVAHLRTGLVKLLH
jgi:gliding motility-associated-like protein